MKEQALGKTTPLKGKFRRYRPGINSLASSTTCRALSIAASQYSETMPSDLRVPSRFEQQFRAERNWYPQSLGIVRDAE